MTGKTLDKGEERQPFVSLLFRLKKLYGQACLYEAAAL